MTFGLVFAIVHHLHVLYIVGHEVIHDLVISLCRKSERTLNHAEPIVKGPHDMNTPLALYLFVQGYDGLSVNR